MSNSKFLLALLLPSVAAVTVAAETSFVTIDGYKVHPTRIIAKYAPQARVATQSAATPTLGLRELRRFKRLPRLAVFEDQNTPSARRLSVAAEEVDTHRQTLLDRITRMRQSGLFEYVEPDYIVSTTRAPNDRAFLDGTLWGLRNLGQNGGKAGADIDAVRAWDITTGSTNVIVAVIDTGIRYTHQDLAAQMWVNPGEVPGDGVDDDGNGIIDDVHGINAILDDGDPVDDNDHGSHVAGTIGAAANDGNPHVGVAWAVRLMACKFLDDQGFGATSDAIECVDYAVNMGAKILNNSWGGGRYNQALFDSIDDARRAGVLFVAAAGNSGEDNDVTPHYPSSYDLENIITVAALDRDDNLAGFSNYGLESVDIGAPGVAIFSCLSGSDSAYGYLDGTSMAAPHVSGVAALVAAQYPGAALAELRDRILFSVVPIIALDGLATTGGRVNAYEALTIAGGPNLALSVDPPSGSAVLSTTNTPIFVRVTSLFGVPDATVTGTFSGVTNFTRTFANNGTAPDALARDDIYTLNLPALGTLGELTLTIVATATNKLATTNTVVYTLVPRPLNDNFVNGTKVPAGGGSFLSNNRFATLEAGEPVHAGVSTVAASLWWAWTASSNGTLLVDTTGSSIDTVAGIYRGNSVLGLTSVGATNDVGSFPQAHISVPVTNGVTYRIAIAGADTTEVGSIRLRVAPGGNLDTQAPGVFIDSPLSGVSTATNDILVVGSAVDPGPDSSGLREVLVRVNDDLAFPANGTTNWSTFVRLRTGLNFITVRADDHAGHSSPLRTIEVTYRPQDPINDLFANAIELAGGSGTTTVGTTNATKESGEPLHAGTSGGKSVWWYFPASADGTLVLSTTNSTFDTVLGVYLGTRVNALTEVASNDDVGGTNTTSQLTFAVRANEVYRIAVDGFDGAYGRASLTHSFTPSGVFHLTVGATTGGTVSPGSGDFGAGSTVLLQATPAVGYIFAGWEGDLTSADNPLSLVVNADTTLTARFNLRTFTDGFESGGFGALPWSSVGAAWTVQTNEVSLGGFAARSGAITHGQSSTLVLTTNTAAGFGSFDLKISTEAEWDLLEFRINGVPDARWSGELGWRTHIFTLPAGTNTLEWRYTKDFNVTIGLDSAFIDNVELPLNPTVLSLTSLPTAGPTIRLRAQDNHIYVIEASSNLQDWQPISTNIPVGGLIQITDPDASLHSSRFYRAVGR